MAITRSALVGGPAKLYYDSQAFWNEDDLTYTVETETADFKAAMFGVIDKKIGSQQVKVPFTPVGLWSAANFAVLFPTAFCSPTIGASMGGSTDKALAIYGSDGQLHTIHNAILTKPPEIRLNSDASLMGSGEFTGLVANTKNPETTSGLYTIAAGSDPGGTFAKTGYVSGARWTGAFGSIMTGIVAEDGWTITCEPQLTPIKVDGVVRDFKMAGVTWRAKCKPHGTAHTAIAVAAASSVSRKAEGSLASATSGALAITNGTVTLTLGNAVMLTHGFRFGAGVLRNGEVGWETTVGFTAGAADALFAVSGLT